MAKKAKKTKTTLVPRKDLLLELTKTKFQLLAVTDQNNNLKSALEQLKSHAKATEEYTTNTMAELRHSNEILERDLNQARNDLHVQTAWWEDKEKARKAEVKRFEEEAAQKAAESPWWKIW